jgi:hypothetical protein
VKFLFLDRKAERFRQALWSDPAEFLDRVAARFMAATLWYVPFDPPQETRHPWTHWCARLTHPLPCLQQPSFHVTSPERSSVDALPKRARTHSPVK